MKRNLIFKLFFYVLGVVITLTAVPIIINALGVKEFGLISLLNSLLAYLSVATMALTSSLGRNLIFSYKDSLLESSKELSTVVFSMLILGLTLIPFFLYFSKSILILVGIEIYYIEDASLIFKFMCGLFIINAISNSIGATFFLKNRLDFLSITGFINQVSTHLFFLLFLFFTSFGLLSYSYAMGLTSLILFIFTYVMYVKTSSEVEIKVSYFSLIKIKENFGMSFWLIVNQVGVLALFQFGVIILQIYEGLDAVAYLAISLVIANQIRAIANLLSSLLEPTLIKHVANNNMNLANSLFEKAVLIISLCTGMVCGIYIGSVEYILKFWLGSYDPIINVISIISVIYLPLTLGFSCSWPLLMAHNKIKIGAIITLISGAIFISTSVILFEYTNMGIYSVLLSTVIVMVLKNNVLMPMLMKSLDMKIKKGLVNASCGFIYMCITIAITKGVFSLLTTINILSVLISISLSVIITTFLLLLAISIHTTVPISEVYKQPKVSLLAMINRV